MKTKELKGKSCEELEKILLGLKKEALNLRFQRAVGELANTARIRTVRKSIARVRTLMNKLAGERDA